MRLIELHREWVDPSVAAASHGGVPKQFAQQSAPNQREILIRGRWVGSATKIVQQIHCEVRAGQIGDFIPEGSQVGHVALCQNFGQQIVADGTGVGPLIELAHVAGNEHKGFKSRESTEIIEKLIAQQNGAPLRTTVD